MKMKCDREYCNNDAEYVVTYADGERKYLCRKHGRDLLKSLAQLEIEKLDWSSEGNAPIGHKWTS